MRTKLAAAFLAALSLPALAPAAHAQDAPAPAAGAAQAAWDYPREVRAGGQRVKLHEPSVLEYALDSGACTLRVPVEVTDGVGRVTWGAAEIAGRAHLDLDARLVLVDGLALGTVAVPEHDATLLAKIVEGLPAVLPAELLLRLELFTDRPNATRLEETPDTKVSMRGPAIVVRRTPALLVQIDGEPVTVKIPESSLEYVVNTATDLVRDPGEGKWYMLVDQWWATAPKIEGPWTWLEGKFPIALTQLPIDHPRGHLRMFIPGTKRNAKRVSKGEPERPAALPEVIVATKPTELVLLRGDPLFTLVPGVTLMTVANSESDILFHPKTAKYFLLLSGRWLSADDVDGPWTEHFGPLPEEFAKIPRNHARGHVRWCVPGTPEAAEAAARAALPERALLHQRIQANVQYDGKKPESAPLDGTEVRRVTNTEDDVLQVGNAFYGCIRGAWFRSSDGTQGWKPVEAVPETLAAVPDGTGFAHVNACKAHGADGKGFRFSVAGAYYGTFVHKGAPVYGNGWDRTGLLRRDNWYPQARAFGENRWYDPAAGIFQPRTVKYDESGRPVSEPWSPYTASYGRVRWYANRYFQGGRRMFPWEQDDPWFDTSAARAYVYSIWTSDVIDRDGLAPDRFPLGDRSAEVSPTDPAVFCNATGHAFRLTAAGGVEGWGDGKWAAVATPDADVRARLDALARVRSFAADLARWAAQRRAPLPENSVF